MLKKNNNKDTIILGVILITFGITLLINNGVKTRREKIFNDMNLLILDSITNEVNSESEVTEPTSEEVIENNEDTNNINNNVNNYEPYLAVLKIPKIDLERGFYDKNSTLNNVDYNILFHSSSNYPGELRGNVILASHSGTSSVSYFRNLYMLEKGDIAYISYNNKQYTYKIVKIYNEDKDGNISIYRDQTKNTLTLITCTKNDNTKQTVYIFEEI